MPKPYSHDLRSGALEACDEGERPSVVAKRFRIGRASVYLWLEQRREEGGDGPKTMGGGPSPVIRDAVEAVLNRLVVSANHLTLAQDRDKLADETGIAVHPWTVGRALRRLRLTRKKEDPPSRTRPRLLRPGRSGALRLTRLPLSAWSLLLRIPCIRHCLSSFSLRPFSLF